MSASSAGSPGQLNAGGFCLDLLPQVVLIILHDDVVRNGHLGCSTFSLVCSLEIATRLRAQKRGARFARVGLGESRFCVLAFASRQ